MRNPKTLYKCKVFGFFWQVFYSSYSLFSSQGKSWLTKNLRRNCIRKFASDAISGVTRRDHVAKNDYWIEFRISLKAFTDNFIQKDVASTVPMIKGQPAHCSYNNKYFPTLAIFDRLIFQRTYSVNVLLIFLFKKMTELIDKTHIHMNAKRRRRQF